MKMARSLNKAQLIGHLGKDPEVRKFANGGSVVTFTVATSEQWKDRNTGERREKTEWHRVAIFSEPLGRVAEQYLRKGDQVFLEGKMETRKWTDQSGQEKYTTEVVLRPYQSDLTLLGGRRDGGDRQPSQSQAQGQGGYQQRQPAPSPQYGGGGYPQEGHPPQRNNMGGPPADIYDGAANGSYGGPTRYPEDEIPF